MVVEHFKNKDAVSVYRRFRERGRMAPDGLAYISSWVDHQFERCYQVMEADDRAVLDEWMANWSEIIDFEVHPVITSEKALETIYAVPVDTHRQPGGHGQTTPAYVPRPRASRF